MKRPVAILSVAAQEDNLGDIEIRRVLLDWLLSCDVELHVYRGAMSESYVNAFPGGESIKWHRNHLTLQMALLRSVMQQRATHFVLAPGPQVFGSLGEFFKSVLNLANATLASLTGGGGHVVGRAFRGTGISRIPSRRILKIAKTSVVRDDVSKRLMMDAADALPDLAFYPRSKNHDRAHVAICLRSEPGVSAAAFDSLFSAIAMVGLKPLVVVQVKRDQLLAREIRARFCVETVSWDDEDHREQMQKVTDAYARSAVVVSNRLHGLIFGARCGAVPIAVAAPGNQKLLPTLRTALSRSNLQFVEDPRGMQDDDWRKVLTFVLSKEAATTLGEDVVLAQERLRQLRQHLVNTVVGGNDDSW